MISVNIHYKHVYKYVVVLNKSRTPDAILNLYEETNNYYHFSHVVQKLHFDKNGDTEH